MAPRRSAGPDGTGPSAVADSAPGIARPGPRPGSARHARHAARLTAVQALYQSEMTGAPLDNLIEEYCAHRLEPGGDMRDSETLGPADESTFRSILLRAGQHRERIESTVRRRLKTDWSFDRIDPVLRACLRAAGGELADPAARPSEVRRDYTELARAFGGDRREVGFAHAMLDAIAEELGCPPSGTAE